MSELSIETPPVPDPCWATASPASSVEPARALVTSDLERVERTLARLLESDIAAIPQVCQHLAFAGGKRLRPLLTLLCAQCVDLERDRAVRLAAVGELLHTATLLHDDVVDGGDLRRGRPSARYTYGNAMAVLSGDFCLAQAVSCAAELGELATLRSVARVVTRMSEGEVAQLQAAGRWTLDEAGYYAICERKTAELIAWCTSLSGLLPASEHAALHRFGLELGYAFQIADDVIDYSHSSAQSGKARAQDLREGKSTLPLIFAQHRAPELSSLLTKLMASPSASADGDTVDEILELVHRCGAVTQATQLAHSHAKKAQQALADVPDSPAKRALLALSEQVAQRRT